MKPDRRSFLSLLGMTPIAAKVTADAETARLAGLFRPDGLGSAGMGLMGGSVGGEPVAADPIPYEKRLIQAADYVKMFGLPDVVHEQLRDHARYVNALDADIAAKRSWSMSVKIMTQRQRNYDRAVLLIEKSVWQHRGRSLLKKALGFEFPW